MEQSGAKVERTVISLQCIELCLEGVDFIDDGLGLIEHLDWPWKVEGLD